MKTIGILTSVMSLIATAIFVAVGLSVADVETFIHCVYGSVASIASFITGMIMIYFCKGDS